MEILAQKLSNDIRNRYIEVFVNSNSAYYLKQIKNRVKFSDGLCYTGYLWDCFKNPCVISECDALEQLNYKKNIYIMWDIHSSDRIWIPNYWKYPKDSVLLVEDWSVDLRKDLPEDIYIFDDSFTWSIVLTHETDILDKPYCLYLEKHQEE